MGIGPVALRLYDELFRSGCLKKGFSVCELGAQDFVPQYYADWAKRIPSKAARKFYEYLGMSYACIDLNGKHDALKLDLNTVVWTGDRFDLVTNHGTTEHVFNQLNCFRLMHDLTKPGGLMIHVVPCQGFRRHGFFVYDELLFEQLEASNGYERISCYEDDDHSGKLIVVVHRRVANAAFVAPMQTVYGAAVPART